jgi:hypothetical protein
MLYVNGGVSTEIIVQVDVDKIGSGQTGGAESPLQSSWISKLVDYHRFTCYLLALLRSILCIVM